MLPTLEGLVTPEQFVQLKTGREESYWDAAVRARYTTDDLVLTALASRFRMKIANVNLVSQQARELVPEQLVRKYRVLPLQRSAARCACRWRRRPRSSSASTRCTARRT
jgi:hypothetical protein